MNMLACSKTSFQSSRGAKCRFHLQSCDLLQYVLSIAPTQERQRSCNLFFPIPIKQQQQQDGHTTQFPVANRESEVLRDPVFQAYYHQEFKSMQKRVTKKRDPSRKDMHQCRLQNRYEKKNPKA